MWERGQWDPAKGLHAVAKPINFLCKDHTWLVFVGKKKKMNLITIKERRNNDDIHSFSTLQITELSLELSMWSDNAKIKLNK